MSDLNELIERLSDAAEGSPELDEAIFQAAFGSDVLASPGRRYSTSVDAALTLVPEGMDWSAGSWSGNFATVGISGDYRAEQSGEGLASPAIALCIAALRALSSRDQGVKS